MEKGRCVIPGNPILSHMRRYGFKKACDRCIFRKTAWQPHGRLIFAVQERRELETSGTGEK